MNIHFFRNIPSIWYDTGTDLNLIKISKCIPSTVKLLMLCFYYPDNQYKVILLL